MNSTTTNETILANRTLLAREWETRHWNFDNFYQAFLTLFVVMTFEGYPGLQNNAIDSTREGKP